MIDSRRVRAAITKTIQFSFLLTFVFILSGQCFGQRQFKLRQMRNEMASKLETYQFGYSWDNRTAFDSLHQVFRNNQKLLTNPFYWKNRPGNSIERDYFRLLANYAIGVLDNTADRDPILRILMEYDPYLLPDASDNYPDLKNHLQQYYPLPALTVGVKVGLNYNLNENTGSSYEIVQNGATGKEYLGNMGWAIHFPVAYQLARNHVLALEPGASYSNIDITQRIINSTQTFKYRIYYGEVPLVYRFTFLNPTLRGFSEINSFSSGLHERLEQKATNLEEKIDRAKASKAVKLQRRRDRKLNRSERIEMNTPYQRIVPSIILGIKPKFRINSFVDSDNANNLTNWYQLDAIGGIGLEWFRSRNTYRIEFRYNYGLTDTNNIERYYLGGEVTGLLFNEFYVSDDFRIQVFEISFTANYILNNKAYKIH